MYELLFVTMVCEGVNGCGLPIRGWWILALMVF